MDKDVSKVIVQVGDEEIGLSASSAKILFGHLRWLYEPREPENIDIVADLHRSANEFIDGLIGETGKAVHDGVMYIRI